MKKRNILIISLLLFYSINSFGQQIIKLVIDTDNNLPGVCAGNAITLIASPSYSFGDPDVVYTWEPCDFLDKCTGNVVVARPTRTITYRVIGRIDYGNGSYGEPFVSVPRVIVVNQPPKLSIVFPPKDTSTCMNQPINILASAEYAIKPKWSAPSGSFIINDTVPLAPTYVPASNQAGKVQVTLTVDPLLYCESATLSKSFSITYVETPVISIQTPDKTICSFEKIPISATAVRYTKLQWRQIGGTGTFDNDTIKNPTYTPGSDDQGKIWVILDAFNQGCIASDTVVFTVIPVNPKPTPDPPDFCEGKSAVLALSPVTSSFTYLWSTGAKTPSINIAPIQNTTYWVQVGNTLCTSGATTTVTIDVNVHENPEITIDKSHLAEKRIDILPDGLEAYIFSVKGTTVQSGLENSFNFGEYVGLTNVINIKAINEWNCEADTLFKITPPTPDAFTPNGDGTNDLLLPGWHITVFDRTQKILYDGSDGWDGRYNGKEMPIGTYFYVVYDLENKIAYKGPVTLLRESINK